MAYKARTLAGAQRRVRELEAQIESWREVADKIATERLLMAKLAAETPQFFNPIVVMEAKQIRDRILKASNAPHEPRGANDQQPLICKPTIENPKARRVVLHAVVRTRLWQSK